MNAGELLLVIKDAITLLQDTQVLLPDGTFDQAKLDTLEEDLDFAVAVEAMLELHGLAIPERVSAIIRILPLIAPLVR